MMTFNFSYTEVACPSASVLSHILGIIEVMQRLSCSLPTVLKKTCGSLNRMISSGFQNGNAAFKKLGVFFFLLFWAGSIRELHPNSGDALCFVIYFWVVYSSLPLCFFHQFNGRYLLSCTLSKTEQVILVIFFSKTNWTLKASREEKISAWPAVNSFKFLAIDEVGDTPYFLLKPVLEKCSMDQLSLIERRNPVSDNLFNCYRIS